MSERKRCIAWGITEYESHSKSGKFVFPVNGSLFGCLDPGSSYPPPSNMHHHSGSSPSPHANSSCLLPFELKTNCRLARLNPLLCPANPDLVAFVGDFDVWLTHLTTGQEIRLTHSHKGHPSLADDPISCGLPSYVMQEEFTRFSGTWWRPVAEGSRHNLLLLATQNNQLS